VQKPPDLPDSRVNSKMKRLPEKETQNAERKRGKRAETERRQRDPESERQRKNYAVWCRQRKNPGSREKRAQAEKRGSECSSRQSAVTCRKRQRGKRKE